MDLRFKTKLVFKPVFVHCMMSHRPPSEHCTLQKGLAIFKHSEVKLMAVMSSAGRCTIRR